MILHKYNVSSYNYMYNAFHCIRKQRYELLRSMTHILRDSHLVTYAIEQMISLTLAPKVGIKYMYVEEISKLIIKNNSALIHHLRSYDFLCSMQLLSDMRQRFLHTQRMFT